MLRVIAYFAKSLKVTQDHWKWHYLEVWVRLPIRILQKKTPKWCGYPAVNKCAYV